MTYSKKSGKCYYCERFYERLTKDHVIPKCKGGGGTGNIVMCCSRCNGYKGKFSLAEFKYLLENFPPEYFTKRGLIKTIVKNINALSEAKGRIAYAVGVVSGLKVVDKIEIPKPFVKLNTIKIKRNKKWQPGLFGIPDSKPNFHVK